MYCAWRIPAHLRCTQCSILLHLMDICFLTCICLWQISQIQTFLFKVVGPGLVSTSPAFVSSSASHPAGPHGRHAQKNGKSVPHCWGRGGSTQFAQPLESAVTAPPLVGCVVWSPTHLFNCTNINTQLKVTDLWTAPVVVGHPWFNGGGHQSTSRPGRRLGGIPSAVVHKTVVGSLHHFSVEGWIQQQQFRV